jgi:hypothetical protein
LAFPLGNLYSRFTEKSMPGQEREAILKTIGHISWMKTHDLAADASSGGATGYKLSPSAQGDKGATINGHNDIFNLRFLAFIANLVFTHAIRPIEMRILNFNAML